MNIWLVKIGEIIPFQKESSKMRTAMLAEALIKRGHQVFWWTSAFDHFNKKWHFEKDTDFELYNGVKVKALKGWGYKKNISFSRWLDARLISKKFKRLALKEKKPDLVVASTPAYDLALEAVIFARENNIPVIVDIRDQWPDIFFDHIPTPLKFLARLALSKDFKIIKRAFQLADGITAISEELLNWALNKYIRRKRNEADRVFYLGYQQKQPLKENEIPQWLNNIKNKFIVLYQGTFNYYHDPTILIDCAKKLQNEQVFFVLAGKGECWERIRKEAEGLFNVAMPGWLDQKELATLLNYSNVGVCTTPQKSYFLPNKAFAYFSAGLPVISAFDGELKEMCEKHQVGFYYSPGNIDELVSHIKLLLKDRERYLKMSKNALNLFKEKFEAEKVYQDFASYLEEIAEKRLKAKSQPINSW